MEGTITYPQQRGQVQIPTRSRPLSKPESSHSISGSCGRQIRAEGATCEVSFWATSGDTTIGREWHLRDTNCSDLRSMGLSRSSREESQAVIRWRTFLLELRLIGPTRAGPITCVERK
jgi:hypothetical protein